MNNEMSNVKVVFEAFKQGVREGKVRYILKHIFGILIGLAIVFYFYSNSDFKEHIFLARRARKQATIEP